jgi:hypothetical protein
MAILKTSLADWKNIPNRHGNVSNLGWIPLPKQDLSGHTGAWVSEASWTASLRVMACPAAWAAW